MRKGLFIVLEGVDGSGKTTQKDFIIGYLKSKFPDKEIVSLREPGGTDLSEKIRKVVLNNKMHEYTRALLYAASRYELSSYIAELLDEGKIVVCDRYIYSSLAYQSTCENDFVEILNINRFEEITIPDYVFHFDINLNTYKQRKMARMEERELDELEKMPDSYFAKNIDNYHRVYDYLTDCYHEEQSGKIITIDANKTLLEVSIQVKNELNQIIKDFKNKEEI